MMMISIVSHYILKASLLTSCCGNDKNSSIPPGPNSGRKRSVALLMVGIGLSLVFQYGVSKLMLDDRIPDRVFLKGYWLDDCLDRFGGNDEAANDETVSSLVQSCVRIQANYRVGIATTLFFLLAAIASGCKRTANREAWPAKLTLYLFLVVATLFLPADPILTDIFLNVARGTYAAAMSDGLPWAERESFSHIMYIQPVVHYLFCSNRW
jgi:hypothetical protein